MMTINAAYALFRDEEIGSLEPGKNADLIIMSDNPPEIAPKQILDLAVWMTMVDGSTRYCETGHNEVCP